MKMSELYFCHKYLFAHIINPNKYLSISYPYYLLHSYHYHKLSSNSSYIYPSQIFILILFCSFSYIYYAIHLSTSDISSIAISLYNSINLCEISNLSNLSCILNNNYS